MRYEGLTASELAERYHLPHCVLRESVTSTLDVVHELGTAGGASGTLVLAEEQVSGRGRQQRPWLSPKGRGIWLGYLFRPEAPVETGLLALRVGLVVARALNSLGALARLKWPNDVLIDDRKAVGVLCEARWREGVATWIAVGIGINVHGPVADEVADRAIAVDDVVPGVTRLAVLDGFMPQLNAMSELPRLSAAERREYGEHDWLAGREIAEPIAGLARGIDPEGALLIESEQGLERIVGGQIVPA